MRFLVKASIPVDAGNDLVRGDFAAQLQSILGDVKPEAVYFGVYEGQRTIFAVVNVDEASQLPGIAEPFWLGLEADVEFIPVMTQEDMAKAAPSIQQAANKY